MTVDLSSGLGSGGDACGRHLFQHRERPGLAERRSDHGLDRRQPPLWPRRQRHDRRTGRPRLPRSAPPGDDFRRRRQPATTPLLGRDRQRHASPAAAGTNSIDGGHGIDTVDYSAPRPMPSAPALTTGRSRGPSTSPTVRSTVTNETLVGIENVVGSAYRDLARSAATARTSYAATAGTTSPSTAVAGNDTAVRRRRERRPRRRPPFRLGIRHRSTPTTPATTPSTARTGNDTFVGASGSDYTDGGDGDRHDRLHVLGHPESA